MILESSKCLLGANSTAHRQSTSCVSLNKNPWNFSKVWKWFIIILSVVLSLNGLPCSSNGKESACNVGDSGLIPGSGRSSGEGNGNPLQYSCLKSPMDSGIAKSQSWLSDLTLHYILSLNKVKVLLAQSCPTLWDPMDWSPLGSSVHGTLQARILKQVANPFFRASSQLRKRGSSCTAGRFFTLWATTSLLFFNNKQKN